MARSERLHWGKLDRRWLAAQVENPANTDWQRVAFAAWLRVGFDGLATFGRGELATAAASLNRDTGELVKLGNAPRAVRQAVFNGWLEEGSTTTRAVVRGDVFGIGKW